MTSRNKNLNMKIITLTLILFSMSLFAKEPYTVYDRENPNDFNSTFVKIDGFQEIKLIIGTGTPYVRSLESLSDRIKLLHCGGGAEGTQVLMIYYYTYILDFKTKKVIDYFEYYDDEGAYTKFDKTPTWTLEENGVEVSYAISDVERDRKFFEIVD